MADRHFGELIRARWAEGKFVCVGLDIEYEKIRAVVTRFDDVGDAMMEFGRRIVNATRNLACAYKLNAAFYLRHGGEGLQALAETTKFIKETAPGIPVIADGKWGDIGNTNDGYATLAFDYLGADAVTVNPYLGQEALRPFLDRTDKGIFMLCRTSNPGAIEFQGLKVRAPDEEMRYVLDSGAETWSMGIGEISTSLSNHVAYRVSKHWNKNGNCGLVVGATYLHELRSIRLIVGDLPILVPDIGTQSGDLKATVKAARCNFIISSSRSIIYASNGHDFVVAARRAIEKLHEQITKYRSALDEQERRGHDRSRNLNQTSRS